MGKADLPASDGPFPAPPAQPGESDYLFDAVLQPNRSLPPIGFYIVIACVGVVALGLGIMFLMVGAWPIFGLYGLDIALLYWALKSNYRSGRMYETVRLTQDTLTVERVDTRGRQSRWQFQPHWLRVHMDDPPEHESQIRLQSHGRTIIIGSFLSPEERLDFAQALQEALVRARATPKPSASPCGTASV